MWANFGTLLLQRMKSFLKAFRWLDKEQSGSFKQSEFIRAYTEVCVQAGESAEDFKQQYELQRADASLLFKLPRGHVGGVFMFFAGFGGAFGGLE